jgi:hypothetical protein
VAGENIKVTLPHNDCGEAVKLLEDLLSTQDVEEIEDFPGSEKIAADGYLLYRDNDKPLCEILTYSTSVVRIDGVGRSGEKKVTVLRCFRMDAKVRKRLEQFVAALQLRKSTHIPGT